jgi:hypothetical protein
MVSDLGSVVRRFPRRDAPGGALLTNPSRGREVVMAADPGPGRAPVSSWQVPLFGRPGRRRSECPPGNISLGLPDLLVDPAQRAVPGRPCRGRASGVVPRERADHQREPVPVGMLAPVLLDRLAEDPVACQAQADSL